MRASGSTRSASTSPVRGVAVNTPGYVDFLDQRGIDTRPFFPPLSSLPAFAATPDVARARQHNTVASRLGAYGINLPSAMLLDEAQVDYVCAAVRDMLGQKSRQESIAV